MAEVTPPSFDSHLARIEPDDRLVVLARTIQARTPEAETVFEDGATYWRRFGETCLGQALYRHRSVFHNAAETPVWSHLELSYFRDIVPADVILELVVNRQPAELHLAAALRADPPNDVDIADAPADLGRMRTIPRWTFSDPVVEADFARLALRQASTRTT